MCRITCIGDDVGGGTIRVANVWLADQPVAEGLGDRLCRLIWKILHERVRYEERGPAVSIEAKKVRARKMIRELRGLGYRVELVAPSATV